MEFRANYVKIEEITNFWGDKMPMMAMEELSECIQAISKYERGKENAEKNLIEEIADVQISLMALMTKYKIDCYKVNQRIIEKTSMEKDN